MIQKTNKKRIIASIYLITLLYLCLAPIEFATAYHDTLGNEPHEHTLRNPGYAPYIFIFLVIIVIAGIIYWKIKYNPEK